MSTSSSTPKRSPRRTTPKRSPLQERSPSQKNEAAARLHKDSRQELSNADVFSTTPFPTKPQHILLPSTIRNKQRGRQNVENELPAFLVNQSMPEAHSSSSNLSTVSQDGRKNRRAPNLQLKRSVTALRDMYEAQAENSRPSSAVTSPVLRPTTAGLRSRSASSSDGRSAWELLGLPKVSADDLAILPTLSEDDIQQINSEASFASRMRLQEESSSPNFRTYGTSSPQFPIYEDVMTSSDPIEGSSSSGHRLVGSSSPNLIQLAQDTSMMTDPTPTSIGPDEEDSSPNVVKLGTTSPQRSSSPTPSQMSTGSRKRKRSPIEGSSNLGRTPLAMMTRRGRALSSPVVQVIQSSSNPSLQSSEIRALPSSPPEMASPQSQSQITTSPIIRVHHGRFSNDSSSVVSAHTNLQSVLSSSPAPPVQRPIVRAPDVNQFEILSMQKRQLSGPSNIIPGTKQRLSPVPSEADLMTQQLALEELRMIEEPPRVASRAASRTSIFTEELDDNLEVDFVPHPHRPYITYDEMNHSQVHMISEADRHEAVDNLSALPREHSSFAAALSQARASLYGSSSSSNSFSRLDSMRSSLDNRIQNMRSFTHGRNESFMSSYRPGSSGSYISMSAMPTWARRYYSGVYQNSFHYLYQSSSNLSYSVKQIVPPPRRSSLLAPCRSYISGSVRSSMEPTSRRSYSQSFRSSIRQFMPTLSRPLIQSSRSRMDVRKSHMTAGIGPLVSHPVRPQSLVLSRTPSSYRNTKALRHVSLPISAADPRWHWRGVIIAPDMVEPQSQSQRPSQEYQRGHPLSQSPYGHSSNPQRTFAAPLSRLLTPRLHRDRRLHTGSTNSAGFGAPYNNKSRWQPSPDLMDNVGQPSWFKVDLRDVQVLCFISGFVFPFTWFIAAFLPLPERPATYYDVEKAELDTQIGHYNARPSMGEWDQMDVLARLRLERHLRGLEEVKWQNARWWRRMNRWMCFVGLVVLVIVISLAVIGTRGHWASGKST